MSWENKGTAIARRSTQTRFVIHTEQLEFGSPEFVKALNAEDENEYLVYSLSISDLKQIIDVFSKEYEERESERQEHINKHKK